jgi:hypothetical protein
LSRSRNYKPYSTRNEKTCAYFSKPSSRSTRHTYVAEVLKRELATSIIASSRIGWANPQSSTEPARTSSPSRCFSVICLSHLPPRPVGPTTTFKVSSRLQPCSKLRARPQGATGLHWSSLRGPPDGRKRPQFILSPHHGGTKWPLSETTSSTIVSPEMPVTTSTSVADVETLTMHLEATTCTGVDIMIALKMEVHLLSHRALESLARPFVGPSF